MRRTAESRRLSLETHPSGTDTFDEGTRISPGSVDRGAVARALRATVKALESALGPASDEETDSDSGDEAINSSQLKPFYDDDGGSECRV